ncbi:MAG: 50S ribosomal protein L24 [archaeon]
MVSKNPAKQRLAIYEADIRQRKALMSVHLSKELHTKHGKRQTTVRVGDTVKILRGDYHGKTGTVQQVDHNRTKVFIQGIMHKKTDGKEAFIAFQPSNLMLTSVDTKDKKRFKKTTKETATKSNEKTEKKE